MMNSVRGRRRRGNPSAGAGAMAALNRYKREQHGHANELRALDPSKTNKRPYNTLKIHIYKESESAANSFTLSVSDIVKALLTQLGMSVQTGSILNVKLQRIDVFAATNNASAGEGLKRPSVTAQLASLIPQLDNPATPANAVVHYPIIKDLSDTGSMAKAARVSYTYPLSMRDIPLNLNSNFIVGSVFANVQDVDVFVHVQWSTSDVSPAVP